MSGNIWYGFLRFLNLLEDLAVYFSIQLGYCVLLSFPVLILVLLLRGSVLRKCIFLKGMVWAVFFVIPFSGKLTLFYDGRWMPGVFLWWNDLCMVCRPVRYAYMLGMAVSAGMMTGSRGRLYRRLRRLNRRFVCGQEILIGEKAATPFASGLFHGKIVVPRVMLEDFREEDLELLLLHENTHIRLGHLWYFFYGMCCGYCCGRIFFLGYV